jgi:hypothetical protein
MVLMDLFSPLGERRRALHAHVSSSRLLSVWSAYAGHHLYVDPFLVTSEVEG